jgi:prophage regulatory protein
MHEVKAEIEAARLRAVHLMVPSRFMQLPPRLPEQGGVRECFLNPHHQLIGLGAQPIRLLRLPSVIASSGRSRSGLYDQIAQGLWTKPVSLGARAVAWPSNEISSLIRASIAGFSEARLRALVVQLHEARLEATMEGATS